MNKVKKGLSLLLTALMVMSVLPVSAFGAKVDGHTVYGAGETDKFTYAPGTVTDPVDFWVDTEGTTETVRIGGDGSDYSKMFQHGNEVVATTPSGVPTIPQTAANYATFWKFGYAGETPSSPKIVMTIHGLNGLTANPTITSSSINFKTSMEPSVTTFTDSDNNPCVKYTWTIGSATVTNGPGAIIYNINFTYNGVPYVQRAYAHAEYVARPGGISLMAERTANVSTRDIWASTLSVIESANSRASISGTSNTHAYIDYTSNKLDSGNLIGMNRSWNGTSGILIKDNTDGTVVYKHVKDGNTTATSVNLNAHGGDTPITTIWVDKGYDWLGNGTGTSFTGNTNATGLNMRQLFKVGCYEEFHFFYLYRYSLYTGDNNNNIVDTTSGLSQAITENGKTVFGTDVTARCINGVNGQDNRTAVRAAGTNDNGESGYLLDYCVAPTNTGANALTGGNTNGQEYMQISYSGVGPSAASANYTINWTGVGQKTDASNNKKRPNESGAGGNSIFGQKYVVTFGESIFVRFRTYDTTSLRTLLNAVNRGQSVTVTTSTGAQVSITGICQNPQSWKFSDSTKWNDFVTAYNTANDRVVDFAVGGSNEQANIDNAITELAAKYNALANCYSSTGKIVVHHYFSGTTIPLIPDQVITYPGTNNTAIKNGARFKVDAATIKGYVKPSVNSFQGAVLFNPNGGEIRNDQWTTVSTTSNAGEARVEYTFYYTAEPQNLIVQPGNGHGYTADDPTVKPVICNYNFDGKPDFDYIKGQINTGDAWEFEKYYKLDGLYMDSAYANKVDEANYTMTLPAAGESAVMMYAKWNPKAVQFNIIAVDGETGNVIGTKNADQTATPTLKSSTPADDNLNDVTFTVPATPSISNLPAGSEFLQYYADAECTKAILTSTISASYADEAEYPIIVGTGDTNSINIYAKFATMTDKIYYEPNGGQLTGVNAFENYVKNTDIAVRIPTRAGYNFTGWRVEGGSVTIGGAAKTTIAPTDTTFRIPDDNGRKLYAQWENKDITVTFTLGFTADANDVFSSRNQTGKSYYWQTTAADNIKADTPIDTSVFPTNPRRYGYDFNGWQIRGGKMLNTEGNYPTEDLTLVATWKTSDKTAFAKISAFEKESGSEIDVEKKPVESETVKVARGDVVTMKVYIRGNFKASSSSFIFFYDGNFYDQIEDIEIVNLNEANSYIGGLKAVKYDDGAYKNSAALEAYLRNHGQTINNVVPGTDTAVSNLQMFQVAIDPDLDELTPNANGFYEAASLNSGECMFEIKLRVSDTATGTGSLWLPTELVRSASNPLGDTFIAYSTDGTLKNVETGSVKFDTDIIFSSTVVDTELSNPESTITVKLPTKNGQVLGSFKYLDGSSKVYTGPYGEEILEVYNKDANGNLVDEDGNIIEHDEYDVTNYAKYGFPGAEREGYTAEGWFKVNNPAEDYDAANHYDTSDEWAVGYYGTEAQNGNTYEVKWEPIDCTLTFDVEGEIETVTKKYDEVLTECPVEVFTFDSDFVGFIPVGEEAKEENIVDFTNYVVKGDADFYAWTIPAQEPVIIGIVDESGTSLGSINLSIAAQAALGVEFRVGDTVRIVDTVPATPEEGVKYVTAETINAFANGTYTNGDYTSPAGFSKTAYKNNYVVKVSELPVDIAVTAFGSEGQVVFEGAVVDVTFDAGDGTFSNGEKTKVISGKYGDAYDVAPISADIVAPFGYEFDRWNPTSDLGKYLTKSYTARYDGVTVNIHYINEDMSTEITGLTPASFKYSAAAKTIANVPAKTGYTGSWILVEPKDGGYSAITGSTALSGNSFTPSADSITVTTSDSGKSYDVYFAAVYTAKEYNVYYNINGSVDPSLSAKVAFGTNYNLAALGTAATGYEIKGWYTNAACTDPETPLAAGSQQTMGSADITYYAKTVAKEYDVNFWNNDGTDAKSTVKVTFAQSIDSKKPADPERDGYTFRGWSFNDKATAGETLGNLSTEGADVYAVWEVNNYTVTYFSMGGSVVAPAYYDYGETIAKPADPTRTGYTFNKWLYSDGDDAGKEFVFEGATMPSHDINLMADWTINTHTYKFYDGKTEIENLRIENRKYGEAVTEPTYSKVGYTFNGWTPVVPTVMGDEDINFYADVTINQYTVTYDSDGGSEVASQKSNYGTAIVEPADPTKTGYTFDKWVYVEDGVEGDEVDFTTATIPAKDITIKAKWTINEYTITFDSDGGSDVADAKYNYNADLTAPTAPTKTGYTFDKWVYADGDNAGSEFVFDGAKMPANDIALKAVWTADEQTYIFYEEIDETQTELFRITKKYDQAIEASEYYRASNYKTGYIFTGWSPEVPATMGLSTSFKANLTKEQYTISFNTDGGNTIDAVQPFYGDVITLPTPVKEGYTFTGWSYNGAPVDYNRSTMEYTVPDFGDSEQEKSVEFVAGWSKNSYNFIFVDEDNEEIDRKSIAYNDVIDADVTAPKKAGYSFENWLYADETVVKLGEDLMPAKDVTVTPKYKQHDYNLVYVLNNGEEPAEGGTVHAGDTVTLRTGDEYTGHTFDGWYTDEDCTMSAGETTFLVPAQTLDGATITLYAKWKINEYKLTIVSDTDDVDETMVKYGTPIEKLDDLEKDGYEFDGWKLGSADGDAVVWEGLTMPDEDLTIVAKWVVNKYFVTFYYNNGEDDLDTEYDFGAEVTEPETDPVKEGHTFSGWTLDGEEVEWPVIVPDYDIEIEATWTPEVYTLAFDANLDGVTDPNSFDATYDTVVNLPELSKEGYVFEGWQLKKDGEGDGQAEIYASGKYLVEDLGDNGDTANFEAVWTANEYKVIFNPNGGVWGGGSTDIIVKKQDCGTAIEVPEKPTRTGYKFVGYKIEETEEIVQDLPTVMGVTPTLGLIYTAQWDANIVPIRFYLDVDENMTAENAATKAEIITKNSSALVMMDTAEFDSEYTVPSYAFGDEVVSTWYDAKGNAYNAGDKITISDDKNAIKLAASATQLTSEESHKAIFNPMGGIWADESAANKEIDVVVNTLISAPTAPTRAGYTFLGWTPEVGVMKGEDIEFKATWEIIPYSVTFYVDEADTTGETFTDLYYGNEIEFPADPEKDGYEFTGWYYATNVSGEITKTDTPAAYGDTMPQNDVYIIGTWVATVRYVTFYAYDTDPLTDEYSVIAGEGIVNPVEVQAGAAFDAIGAIAAPEYANFTFAGWFDGTGAQWVEGTAVNENISLYAKYDRVAVKLVPASETSTAMIERNGVVETWNTLAEGTTINGVTSVIEPNMNAYETPADFETYYVYGLEQGLTQAKLAEFVKVQGDGKYTVTEVVTGTVGTGAKITVTDNVTNATVEEFYVVIYGDLDGNSYISSSDTSVIKREIREQSWSVPGSMIYYLVKAIDLDQNGYITSSDTALEKTAVKELGESIDQITVKSIA